ncbi:hypothetical protein [Chromobacterium sphagni]|uniref:hypothetical protein n=1 Tax=Chromobacterium sphagni TaxID=1903179 RepID=UPI0011144835|nr:hypothetical protein [Chromobacterium sphagni]
MARNNRLARIVARNGHHAANRVVMPKPWPYGMLGVDGLAKTGHFRVPARDRGKTIYRESGRLQPAAIRLAAGRCGRANIGTASSCAQSL